MNYLKDFIHIYDNETDFYLQARNNASISKICNIIFSMRKSFEQFFLFSIKKKKEEKNIQCVTASSKYSSS